MHENCLGCTPVSAAASLPDKLGLSVGLVRRLVSDGVLVRLRRGILVGCCVVERAAVDRRSAHGLRLRTLLTVYDDCVAGAESAALLLGWPLLDLPSRPVLLRAAGAWRGGDDVRVRIAHLPDHHIVELDGIRCTVPARTVVDIARSASFRQAVVVGDAAVARVCTEAELHAMLDECSEWADLGKARKAIPFFDARAESPLESVSRAIMHEYDVPPPDLQHEIHLDSQTYRADFYWKQTRTIGEADGRAKYSMDPDRTPEEVVYAEKVREDNLRDEGHPFVRWNYRQMLHQTEVTIGRIMRRLKP